MQQVWHLQSLSSLTPVSYSGKILQAGLLLILQIKVDVYLLMRKISSQIPAQSLCLQKS